MKRFLAVLFSFFLLTPPVFAAHYVIDSDHSTVSFKVKHLLSNVQGVFKTFEGEFDYDPEHPESWKTNAVIQAASIDTNVPQRDKHLKSADFFDAEKFPVVTFQSAEVTSVTPTSAKLKGTLTLHGVEKPIELDLQILGAATDPWGNTLASFSASTTINRKDFGLSWNQVLETGQLLVGEDVVIVLDVAGMLKTQ